MCTVFPSESGFILRKALDTDTICGPGKDEGRGPAASNVLLTKYEVTSTKGVPYVTTLGRYPP